MSGCDKPTLIERIVDVFPGPYVLKCFAFACVLGVPLLVLTRFLDLFNASGTLAIFGIPFSWQGVVTFSVANLVLLFYGTYSVRYMRSKIALKLNDVEPVTLENRKMIHRIFSPVCKVYPAVILSVLLFAATLASFPNILQHASGTISLIQVAASFPFVYLTYGTFVWVYASSIRSLHELGKQSFLPLSEFYDDPHFGMKPLGNLSLSLALVYFAGLGLVFFSFISIPAPLEFAVGILVFSGLILFFLPLNAIHQKMQEKKHEESTKLKNHFRRLRDSVGNSSGDIDLGDIKNVRHIVALDIIDRQIASIPEWPFDSKTLAWLSAIVLTVLGSILTRYVLIFLGL